MSYVTQRPHSYCINTATAGFRISLPELIDACAAREITTISPWRQEFEKTPVQAISRQLKSCHMSAAGLCRSTYYTAQNLSDRSAAINDNRKALDLAAELQCAHFVQVVGGLPGGSKQLAQARHQAKNGIQQLLEHSRQVGVRIALEPLHPMTTSDRSCLNTLSMALDWCDELDPEGVYGLGVVVDVYHVWWDPDLYNQIKRAGHRILAFHVSDWLMPMTDLVNDRGMPGDGIIDIPLIRQWVTAAGYTGVTELEVFSKNNWWKQPLEYTLETALGRLSTSC
ncbi:sugar phosphate isomerase/epimerase family protein [Salmonella enterica]|uniref:sugar phosphate isomerase/epimerase family protein n=1 Tax=Salmonella enterica TaxID=28901 RepID=UPI003D3189E5